MASELKWLFNGVGMLTVLGCGFATLYLIVVGSPTPPPLVPAPQKIDVTSDLQNYNILFYKLLILWLVIEGVAYLAGRLLSDPKNWSPPPKFLWQGGQIIMRLLGGASFLGALYVNYQGAGSLPHAPFSGASVALLNYALLGVLWLLIFPPPKRPVFNIGKILDLGTALIISFIFVLALVRLVQALF